MLKEKIRESESSLSQEQCQWQNRAFSRDGKVYHTGRLFDSQEKAESAMQEDLRKISSGEYVLKYPQGNLDYADYAWHMQIPIINQ